MSERQHHTEPVILCNSGTERTDLRFGALALHDFTRATGVQQIIAPEASLFLIETGVTVTDVWEGLRQRQRTYEDGDLIFLPANSEVSAPYVSNTYSETMLRIPCDQLAAAAGDIDVHALDLRYCAIPVRHTFGLARAVRNVARAGLLEPLVPTLTESMTMALCAKVVHAITRPQQELHQVSFGLSAHRRRKAIEFIETNLSRAITLADIASAAALSPYHFVRAFKASMGVSPVRYLWQRRIARAQHMLKTTALPLVDVALSCGYSTQSHFTTTFKMATGMTPAAYRRAVI